MSERLVPYVEAALIAELARRKPEGSNFVGYDQLTQNLRSILRVDVESNDLLSATQRLIERGVVASVTDELAGEFFDVSPLKAKEVFEDEVREPESLVRKYAIVGSSFLSRAMQNDIVSSDLSNTDQAGHVSVAPASDRIVTFSDNQINELDHDVSRVIDEVSAQNQIDNNPGLREVVLGQLRAGRELIRAGSLKLFILEVTLIDALRFLAARYEKEAIGGLAGALIAALLKHIGLDS